MTTIYQQLWTGTNGTAWPDFIDPEGFHVIQSNEGDQQTGTSAAFSRATSYYDPPGMVQDFIMTVDCRLQGGITDADFYIAIACRGATDGYANLAMLSSWEVQYSSAFGTSLYRVDGAGTQTFLTGVTDPTCVTGDTLHVKIAPVGTTFKIKMWKNAQAEPGSFETFVDASAPTGTRIGLACQQGATAGTMNLRWDNLLIDDGIASGQPIGKRRGGIPFAGGSSRGRW